MNNKQISTLIGIFYGISAILMLIGAFLGLRHHPNGLLILLIGFILGSLTSSLDIFQKKKKIKNLEEQLKQKE